MAAAAAFIGLIYRLSSGGYSFMGFANSALSTSLLLCWLGVRAYLGLPTRVRWILPIVVAVTLINAVLFNVDAFVGGRPTFFLVTAVVFNGATILDLILCKQRNYHHGERALMALTAIEFLVLLVVTGNLLLVGVTEVMTFKSPPIRTIMVALFGSALLRLTVYLSLISYSLQEQNDAAQEDLRARDRQSRALLEHLQAGLLIVNHDGVICRGNSLARQLLDNGNWRPEDGRMLNAEVMKSWVDEASEPMNLAQTPHLRIIRGDSQVQDLVMGIRDEQTGQVRWLLCNAYASHDPHPQVVMVFIDYGGIRAARARELELQARHLESQKMEALGSLASGVAHDFNSILAAILGNNQILKEELHDNAEAQQTIEQVSKAARRGRDLVRRILAFGRRQGVTRVPVDIVELMEDTHSLLSALRGPNIEIQCDVPRSLPSVLGDPTQLTQVLLNLGTNAVHAIGKEGRGLVHLSADLVRADKIERDGQVGRGPWWNTGDLVRIRVSDNGSGMDEATLSRIFEPFFTTKPVGQGTGLGLAAVMGIVESHGGTMQVKSVPGAGTTFTMLLPLGTPFDASTRDAQLDADSKLASPEASASDFADLDL